MVIEDEPDAVTRAIDAEAAAFRERRAAIEQAKGILVHLLQVEPDAAFAILSRYSQHQNVKVHILAARLVDAAVLDLTPRKHETERSLSALLDELARGTPDDQHRDGGDPPQPPS